jgi:D-alanyl-D-alanine dipeptidase
MKRVLFVICVALMLPVHVVAQALDVNFEAKMREYKLVNIRDIDPTILVDLKYSTEDNFVGVDMYGGLDRAYLEKDFANMVVRAQKLLKKLDANYTLLIYDAARPISVQRAMRKSVEGTQFEGFVADGTRGCRHNYGVGVDLTIATLDGKPLDMGAGFDDFTEAASVKGTPDNSDPSSRTIEVYRTYINSMVSKGIISSEAAQNRMLLIEIMHEVGLYPYRREWWHFEEITPMSDVRSNYKLLDF